MRLRTKLRSRWDESFCTLGPAWVFWKDSYLAWARHAGPAGYGLWVGLGTCSVLTRKPHLWECGLDIQNQAEVLTIIGAVKLVCTHTVIGRLVREAPTWWHDISWEQLPCSIKLPKCHPHTLLPFVSDKWHCTKNVVIIRTPFEGKQMWYLFY